MKGLFDVLSWATYVKYMTDYQKRSKIHYKPPKTVTSVSVAFLRPAMHLGYGTRSDPLQLEVVALEELPLPVVLPHSGGPFPDGIRLTVHQAPQPTPFGQY